MQVNRNYYEYGSTLVNGVELSKRIRDLTNFKLNQELDNSIFFVQNNTNPNHVKPASAIIQYKPQTGSDVNRVWYNPNSSYGTLETGENVVNPPISELFDKNMKVRLALCEYGSSIDQNSRIGYSATTVPSDLTYTYPWLNNDYKKIIVVVFLGCYRVKYGSVSSLGYYTISPDKYNDNIVAKVADGTYPDTETAKLYNPIIGINCYIGYFDNTTNTWKKLSEYEGMLFDVTHKSKNLYYAHNLLFNFASSGSYGKSSMSIGNMISIIRTSTSTGASSNFLKYFNIRNERDVPYWKGSIPQFELTDWAEGRMQVIHNTMDSEYNPDDLRYWQMYDYSVTSTKYTQLYCCITIEGVKRYIASLGLFFTTNGLPAFNTDLSDLDNLPDYIHMPEVTANGFTTNNYFSGKEIGKSNSPNKNWNSTTDSTIKVDAESGDGNNVENLEFAKLNGNTNKFVKSYILSYSDLTQLSHQFEEPTNPIMAGATPFDNIISLKQYPFDLSLPQVTDWIFEEIVLDKWKTNVTGKRVNAQNMLRAIGTYKIEKKYDSFLDYEPFTTAEIYVPMCGRASLPLNYIMGKNITVYFASDIENGGCKAIVKCDEISAELSGTFSEDVTLTAENVGLKRLEMAYGIVSFGTSVAGMVGSALDGKSLGVALSGGAVASSLIGLGETENSNYSVIKGESTPKVNFNNISKCYIKISRPIIELPENYGRVNGFIVNKKINLSNLNGYTICCNVDVDGLYCTENEKEMLKGIMESGFYI